MSFWVGMSARAARAKNFPVPKNVPDHAMFEGYSFKPEEDVETYGDLDPGAQRVSFKLEGTWRWTKPTPAPDNNVLQCVQCSQLVELPGKYFAGYKPTCEACIEKE